jgi:hypothetical protein
MEACWLKGRKVSAYHLVRSFQRVAMLVLIHPITS